MFFRRGPMDGAPCDISYKNNSSRWVCIVVVRTMPEKYATLSLKGSDQIDPLQSTRSTCHLLCKRFQSAISSSGNPNRHARPGASTGYAAIETV